MKFIMKKRLYFAAIILSMFFVAPLMTSCSSDDSSNNGGNPGGGDEDDTDPTIYQYAQKVLVEDITSASCMWCPLATFTTEELPKSEYSDKIISVAVHGDYEIRNVKDPFVLPGMTDLMRAVKLGGWPFIAWNRNTTIGGSEFQTFLDYNDTGDGYILDNDLFKNFYEKYNLFTESSPIGIKIESNLTNTDGKVTFSLKFGKDLNQELKYVVYIIEDGLKFQQANASLLYGNKNEGQGRWEMNFIHNQVVRATNNFLGESIDANESVTDNEYTVSTDLTYTLEDISNASVVVAILDKDGRVLNVQKALANTTQDYEVIE